MAHREELQFRTAGPADAQAIAALHADSWRRHYRGAYADAFLDGEVADDRIAVWTDRLQQPDSRRHTIVAEHGGRLIGFAHTVFEDDPTWGALLDNLHVTYARKRQGVGSRLLDLTARAVIDRGTGLYLWVLEQNVDAQAFYEARGAKRIERVLVSPPAERAGRLNGTPAALRYAWNDPAALLRSR